MTTFEADLKALIDGKTGSPGMLGRLERIAAQAARVQGRLDPVMRDCALVVFAADHGIAEEGVSAFPPAVTRQMVTAFAAGSAAASVFARVNGLAPSVVNAGVAGGPFEMAEVEERALGKGTANFRHGPAMTETQVAGALDAGREIGARGKVQAMAFGDMGIGNTASASMIAHRLSGAPLRRVTGRGAGLDDEGLLHKVAVLETAARRVALPLGPEAVLREFGGFEIAMMAGAMLGAAREGRLVLVDGFIASAAALVAAQMVPPTREAMVFCSLSPEPGHRLLLEAMGARPLLQLDLRLGEGTGAALAWPLVRAAVAMLNEMAPFAGSEAARAGGADPAAG
jgi:nicotinate-nucleotide--dimethylbenzimidazole phosphoribosyltransferase